MVVIPAPITQNSSSISGILGSNPYSPTKASVSKCDLPVKSPSVTPYGSELKGAPTNFSWAAHLKPSCRIPNSSAKILVSPEGRFRVKVPNDVFERGAKIHSDYIVGIFYGNPPSYGKIWGVLNFLWGKDKRVTVHNLTKNAFLFYIPSPTLGRRVLQHELWRVGDSPFFVTEWKAAYSLHPPSLEKAPIWAKVGNIPFDLVTEEGLSYFARPLGQVVDAKPFTSINSAEIKVIVDLTKPLPKELEIERDDGAICIISVAYPWLPPLCPICNNIGHKAALCPEVALEKVSNASVPPANKGKKKVFDPPNHVHSVTSMGKIYVPKAPKTVGASSSQQENEVQPKSVPEVSLPEIAQVEVIISDLVVDPSVSSGVAGPEGVSAISVVSPVAAGSVPVSEKA